jgi:pimeloyl-ACP methyl ester carboxylesterase
MGRLVAAMGPLSAKVREKALRRWRLRYALYKNVFHSPHELRPELLWEFSHGATGAPAFMAALTGLLGYDHVDRLEQVHVPTLIVWGRNDRVIPASDSLEFERHLSDSQLVIFGRCGHVPMAERPVRFNRTLERFIAE